MKLYPLLALLIVTPALADDTVLTFGLSGDMRARGPTFDATSNARAKPLLGGRLTLAFEHAPLALPPDPLVDKEPRLVPEVFAGFLSNDERAEGYAGAGLRGEVQIANGHRGDRMALYVATRAMIIGKHQDGAMEFVVGGYILGAGTSRFGWEGGAIARPHASDNPEHSHELDAMFTLYVGH